MLLPLVAWSLFFSLTLSCSSTSHEESETLSMAINEVQEMHNCRLKAQNKEFYLHKYRAEKLTRGMNETKALSSEAQHLFITYSSLIAFEMADYLLQIGNTDEAEQVMQQLSANTSLNITTDTVQWLNYLYHQGKVLFRPYHISSREKSLMQGYDCLVQCFILATRRGYEQYEALALQTLSMYLRNDSILSLARSFDSASLRYLNDNAASDSLLAGNLSERAVDILMALNEPYLTADAWRNNAEYLLSIGQTEEALRCLNHASSIPEANEAPDLMARISELFSMAYAAQNNKHMSDYYRNTYLDLQDSTRQDRMLEARATALQETTQRIWTYVAWAVVAFIILCAAVIFLTLLRRKQEQKQGDAEEIETLREEQDMMRLQLSNEQRTAIEQRARIAIVGGMLPLIDRMKLAVTKGHLDYAAEISTAIDLQNAMLTEWIKLKQGSLAPKIETVSLAHIFSLIEGSSKVLLQSGTKLSITPCSAIIKADSTLTLFIINTLIENARKAMPNGGNITLSCHEDKEQGYAEVSISDDGSGMTEEQLAKATDPLQTLSEGATHGFGLINCKGIIERYRKLSPLFSVCAFFISSTVGKGTTIRFRMPLVIKMLFVIFTLCPTLLFSAPDTLATHTTQASLVEVHTMAESLVDSIYECNVNGRYTDAMVFADSCISLIDQGDTLTDELRLSLYNETAVAALSIHDWDKYRYYNYRYTSLYKECTADTTLTTYCQTMEEREYLANVMVLMMLILIAMLLPALWHFYLRHLLRRRHLVNIQRAELLESIAMLSKERDCLHVINNITYNQLSTLKHETMYYPSRIQRLITGGTDAEELSATVSYYRNLYAILSTRGLTEQMEHYTFRVSPQQVAGKRILAHPELLTLFHVILKQHNGGTMPKAEVTNHNEQYVTISYSMPDLTLSDADTQALFTPATSHTDFLILRQILRETGHASLHYSSGISAHYATSGIAIITQWPAAR